MIYLLNEIEHMYLYRRRNLESAFLHFRENNVVKENSEFRIVSNEHKIDNTVSINF